MVRPIDFRETTELYEIRVALEDVSVERACRAADRELLKDLASVWSREDRHRGADLDIVYADEQFHETIALAGGNQILHTMLKGINARLHVLRVKDFAAQPRVDATFQQHVTILSAILRGDNRLATALIRAHILESQAYVEQVARQLEAGER